MAEPSSEGCGLLPAFIDEVQLPSASTRRPRPSAAALMRPPRRPSRRKARRSIRPARSLWGLGAFVDRRDESGSL